VGSDARAVTATHIGGPTTLVEIGGWRALTDPTFDPPGGHYAFGWGTSSDKVVGPAVPAAEIGPLDLVLLTHDQHGDNLDTAGRALLPSVPTVLTTPSAARRLGVAGARGLRQGVPLVLEAPDREPLEVTATPARHGPPLSRPVVGEVVGFLLRCAGTTVWITGDTVDHRALRRAVRDVRIDVMVVHVGGVRFRPTGPVRYSLTGRKAVDLVRSVRPRVAVPVHYEGWTHFADGPAGLERSLDAAPEDVRARVRRLPQGVRTEV
jgi:L-ascorbate metabolism protein UlaG (beta-lactamase superfamily)